MKMTMSNMVKRIMPVVIFSGAMAASGCANTTAQRSSKSKEDAPPSIAIPIPTFAVFAVKQPPTAPVARTKTNAVVISSFYLHELDLLQKILPETFIREFRNKEDGFYIIAGKLFVVSTSEPSVSNDEEAVKSTDQKIAKGIELIYPNKNIEIVLPQPSCWYHYNPFHVKLLTMVVRLHFSETGSPKNDKTNRLGELTELVRKKGGTLLFGDLEQVKKAEASAPAPAPATK